MEVRSVEFERKDKKGPADVWLQSSYALGRFVIFGDFYDYLGHLPNYHDEDMVRRRIGIPSVPNKVAKAAESEGLEALEHFVRLTDGEPDGFKLRHRNMLIRDGEGGELLITAKRFQELVPPSPEV